MFVIRALTFLATCFFLYLAVRTTVENKINRFGEGYGIIYWAIALGLGLYSVCELITGNPNEWLAMKLSFYVIVWAFDAEWAIEKTVLTHRWNKKVHTIYLVLCGVLLVAFASFCFFFWMGDEYKPPTTKQQELLNSVELVAAGDSYRVNGSGYISAFSGGTFAISDQGVYRYYYHTPDGGIKQGYVDAANTTIYYLDDDQKPHLDWRCEKEYWYTTHNNQQVENSRTVGSWQELYIPAGSIVEAYQLDLN